MSWKEIREAWYWLKLIHRAELIKPSRIEELLSEARELTAILGKSLATARRKPKPPDADSPANS